jgi:predicted nucleic acid-binding protein
VVCDAGPLIALGKLNLLYLLERLYGRVAVGSTVYEETVVSGAAQGYPDALVIDWYFKKKVLLKRKPRSLRTVHRLAKTFGVQAGDAETIVLAKQMGADLLLIDDGDARGVAKSKGVKIKGTLGVLIEAYEKQILTLNEVEAIFFQIEKRKDIWISKRLCREVFAKLKVSSLGEQD